MSRESGGENRARLANSATESCSGRAVGSMPADADAVFRIGRQRLQALAQHLAALAEGGGRHASPDRPDRAGATGSASGSRRTTLEVTFGGGTKALRETSNRIFGVVRHCGSTDSRP